MSNKYNGNLRMFERSLWMLFNVSFCESSFRCDSDQPALGFSADIQSGQRSHFLLIIFPA